MILDGIMQLLQNYFLLLSTFYAIMTYINMFTPCFTVILYNNTLVPKTFWTVLGIIQYVMPLIVLMQIKCRQRSGFTGFYIPFLCIHGFR